MIFLPCDVEDLSDGVENGEGSGVVFDDEDDGGDDGEQPAQSEADNPSDESRLQRALALGHLGHLILHFFVSVISSFLVALIPHDFIKIISIKNRKA